MPLDHLRSIPSLLRAADFFWGARALTEHPRTHHVACLQLDGFPVAWMQGQCHRAARAIESALESEGVEPAAWEGPLWVGPTGDEEPVGDPARIADAARRCIERALEEVELELESATRVAGDQLGLARRNLQAVVEEFEYEGRAPGSS